MPERESSIQMGVMSPRREQIPIVNVPHLLRAHNIISAQRLARLARMARPCELSRELHLDYRCRRR
jgi:hypothetical protein